MKQKFRMFSFVKVDDEMPEIMGHFPSGFDAIIGGSYSQLHGGNNIDSYRLYMLEDGKIIDEIAWYDEDQLTVYLYQDRDFAEEMVENYNCG